MTQNHNWTEQEKADMTIKTSIGANVQLPVALSARITRHKLSLEERGIITTKKALILKFIEIGLKQEEGK